MISRHLQIKKDKKVLTKETKKKSKNKQIHK